MEAQALLRINAHEERFLPVELKIRMLMEQAGMRMRASAMVGERIAQLDDVVRVRALVSIVSEGTKSSPAAPAASAAAEGSNRREEIRAEPDGSEGGKSMEGTSSRCLPSVEEMEMFKRMAVSSLKTVLFQIADEAESEIAKDVIDVYEGVITTEDLCLKAAEGFPTLNVDSLLSSKHLRYLKLLGSRHRFLLRKLGVLLDMKEGLDTLLELAADTKTLEDSFADVDLSSPEDEEQASKLPSAEGKGTATPRKIESVEGTSVVHRFLLFTPSAKAKAKAMSALQNTSWDKEASSEDTTEDETDADTPPQGHTAEVSPSR